MSPQDEQWSAGGRSPGWRLGMLLIGALLLGYAAAIVWWPRVLVWTFAGAVGLVGLVLVLSALFARGRQRRS